MNVLICNKFCELNNKRKEKKNIKIVFGIWILHSMEFKSWIYIPIGFLFLLDTFGYATGNTTNSYSKG